MQCGKERVDESRRTIADVIFSLSRRFRHGTGDGQVLSTSVDTEFAAGSKLGTFLPRQVTPEVLVKWIL